MGGGTEATCPCTDCESEVLLPTANMIAFITDLHRRGKCHKEMVDIVKGIFKREKQQRLIAGLEKKEKEIRARNAMKRCQAKNGELSKQPQPILEDEWEVASTCSYDKLQSSQDDTKATSRIDFIADTSASSFDELSEQIKSSLEDEWEVTSTCSYDKLQFSQEDTKAINTPGIDFIADTSASSFDELGKQLKSSLDDAPEGTSPSDDWTHDFSMSNGNIDFWSYFDTKEELEEKAKRLEKCNKELAIFEDKQHMVMDVYKKDIERMKKEKAKVQNLISHNQMYNDIHRAEVEYFKEIIEKIRKDREP